MPASQTQSKTPVEQLQELPHITDVPVLRLRPPVPRTSKGTSHDIPYVLRGRNEEFSHIASTLTNPAATTYVVEGPPGTGKTALVKSVGAYAATCGYTVLTLEASEAQTPCTVVNQLWTLFDSSGVPNHLRQPGHVSVRAFNPLSVGDDLGEHEQHQISIVLRHLIDQCYAEFGTKKQFTRGFLIIFDNATTWRDATQRGHPVTADPSRHSAMH